MNPNPNPYGSRPAHAWGGCRPGIALLLLLCGSQAQYGAQLLPTSFTNSMISIVNEAVEIIPPKPLGLTNVPWAKIQVDDTGPYARPLQSHLVHIFTQAQRPRITEGDNFSYTIRATILSQPEMTQVKASGGKANAGDAFKSLGKLFGSKPSGLTDNLNLNDTNLLVEVRCEVELELLDAQKTVITNESKRIIKSDNLRALSIQFNDFNAGSASPEDANAFLRNISQTSAKQALVNLAAYHAATNLLEVADDIFLNPPAVLEPPKVAITAPAPSPVPAAPAPPPTPAPAAPAVPTTPGSETVWLTPTEAAAKLKMTEADIIKALEKGDIKGKKIGSIWRISSKELE